MPEFDRDSIDRLLTTTRAVRRRLDLERPVSRDVIEECLRLALQAPNGSNHQTWRWLVVTDPATRRTLGDLYRAGSDVARRRAASGSPAPTPLASGAIADSAAYLLAHLQDVPVIVIPCIDASSGGAAGWAPSIYPAIWSFMLALRSRGLGSCLTTVHLYQEREAAALLGIPDGIAQAALLPVAYYTGDTFRPGARRPLEDVTYWEHWGDTG